MMLSDRDIRDLILALNHSICNDDGHGRVDSWKSLAEHLRGLLNAGAERYRLEPARRK